MAKHQRSGNAWKNGYSRYKAESRRMKNKIRRLTNYVRKNPKDLQAAKALEGMKHDTTYKRKASGGSGQTINSQKLNKVEASLHRANEHRAKFGQNESKAPSRSDIYEKMARALAGNPKYAEALKRLGIR